MKTKNTKVRIEDIKAGVTVYVSHPVYGIEECRVTGKPFMNHGIGYSFNYTSNCDFVRSRSCCDSGISNGNGYNNHRTFFKRKHAEEWARKMKTDPGFIKQQASHERLVSEMRDWFV